MLAKETGGAGTMSRGMIADRHQHRSLSSRSRRERKIMRGILEVLERRRPSRSASSPSRRWSRCDIEHPRADGQSAILPRVAISITSLDPQLGAPPWSRARADAAAAAGGAQSALGSRHSDHRDGGGPVIPALNDSEDRAHPRWPPRMPGAKGSKLCAAAAAAGSARTSFREWLMANYPDRYRHVFTLIRDMRGGPRLRLAMGQRA